MPNTKVKFINALIAGFVAGTALQVFKWYISVDSWGLLNTMLFMVVLQLYHCCYYVTVVVEHCVDGG